MDLSGKSYSPSGSFLSTSSLMSHYGLATSLTTSFGTNQALTSPIYSGSSNTGIPLGITPSHSKSHNQGLNSSMSSNASDANPGFSGSSPSLLCRGSDTFPYGLSGVAMPNYGYHGDVYQFTSNGYPRKSRTCSYCGKVFTRSTTRRYHEKRCPLLRAAVSSYVPSDDKNSAHHKPEQQSGELNNSQHLRVGEKTHQAISSVSKNQGQSLDLQMQISAVTNRSSIDPQELATSELLSPPPHVAKREDPLSGYHTSVIVKQEPHELEGSFIGQESHTQESEDPSVLRLTPESVDSSQGQDTGSYNLSPSYPSGLDLSSKSPSHTSGGNVKDDNTSGLSENISKEQYRNMSDSPYTNRADSETDIDYSQGLLPGIQEFGSVENRQFDSGLITENGSASDLATGQDASVRHEAEEKDFQGIEDDIGDQEVETINQEVENGSENGSVSGKKDKLLTGSFKCTICGKNFESSGKLHLHEQLHTKFKPYPCKYCGQKFAKAALRIAHEKTHNITESSHICAVCGSIFTRKYTLKLHMRRWHQEGPWLCRHCGKASLTQIELKTHLYSHNLPRMERESLKYIPDVPLSVNSTSLATGVNGAVTMEYTDGSGTLTNTMAGTNGEVGYMASQEMEMCTECGRDFPKGYMRYHLKSHEAQKPYSCPICGKRFGYKNNMKSHIKLHTGVKPFQCNICGAKFTRGSTLRRHARRHGIIAESVWDLFIKPDYKSKRGAASRNLQFSSNQPPVEGQIQENVGTVNSQGSMLDLTSRHGNGDQSHTGVSAGSMADMSSQLNYLDQQPIISPTSNHSLYSMYSGYNHLQAAPMFSPAPLTTSPPIPHMPSAGFFSSQEPQLDALNLSVNKPMDQQSDQSGFSAVSGERSASAERSRSRSRSCSGSESRRSSYAPTRPGFSDASAQVHTCCYSRLRESTPPPPVAQGLASPQGGSTGSYEATSPGSVGSGKDILAETISSLMASGKMFRCIHCECYFSEYAMYRIHAKLHIRDFSRPFLCPVCGEDCHDRVYFTLHVSEHLR